MASRSCEPRYLPPMKAAELIGREVSLPIAGSRRRERGYVAEALPEGLLVHLYREQGEIAEHVLPTAAVRLLRSGVPSGWRALNLLTEEGEPHIALRFRPEVIAAIKRVAAKRGRGPEEAINHLLRVGLDGLESISEASRQERSYL